MCSPGLLMAMQGGQAISNIAGNYASTKIQQTQYKTKAGIEEANAKIIEGQAKQVDYNAQLAENRLRQESENLRAAQITAMGASGIALDSPSFQSILEQTDTYEAIDISLLRQSAGYEKASLLESANQRRQLASSYSGTAKQLGKNARMGLFTDTISSVANIGASYAINKSAFDKYNLKKSKTSYGSYEGRSYINNPI